MATADHYGLLGITETEPARGIESAFRDLTRAHHPERGGPDATRRYRETVLAHAVLSDTTRRVIYERERARRAAVPSPSREEHDDLRAHLIDDLVVREPSAEEVLAHIRRNYEELDPPKSARVRVLSIRLVVPESDRAVLLSVPIFFPCPTCHGVGALGERPCGPCDAQGMHEGNEEVRVGPPKELVHLDALGIHNLALEVAFAPY